MTPERLHRALQRSGETTPESAALFNVIRQCYGHRLTSDELEEVRRGVTGLSQAAAARPGGLGHLQSAGNRGFREVVADAHARAGLQQGIDAVVLVVARRHVAEALSYRLPGELPG